MSEPVDGARLREALACLTTHVVDQQDCGKCRHFLDVVRGQMDALLARLAALEGERDRLLAVLGELFALISEGRLVRDTSADADTPTYLKQSVRLVKALADVKAALEARDA